MGSQEPAEGEEAAAAPTDPAAPASPTQIPSRWQGASPDA